MSGIVQQTEDFASDLLKRELDPSYRYHNLTHTRRVVKSIEILLKHSKLSESEKDILRLAGWLHDVGYTKGGTNHEQKSCEIAQEFLEKNGLEAQDIESVLSIIKATERYAEPTNEMEKIIRDADTSHFAKESYIEIATELRSELDELGMATFTNLEWTEANIKMFEQEHQYHTDFAKENWEKGKAKNLALLKKELKLEKNIAKKEKIKAKYKSESPDRGIQTLFRVTLKNHIQLSDIADTKANILLSVNAIVISVALSSLIPKLDNPSNSYLIYPALIFIFFSVVSMILAVLATRPKITSGIFTKKDVEEKKVNLLFFGNFHKMSLQEYEWAILELVKDKDYIYSTLTKDLYYLGLVLNRKYKILRWTYTIFMIGIVISVLAFGIAFKIYSAGKI